MSADQRLTDCANQTVALLVKSYRRMTVTVEDLREDTMHFMISMKFTDQGIRTIKDAPKRTKAARELAKKLGVEIKNVYLTSGESDLVAIVETSNGDNVAKMALALGSIGNVHTRMSRAWTEEEYFKLVSELP
jgi:uncharacterized protein with GYD domain